MAQFDVHRNRGPSREDFPYVVVVQSRRLDDYGRRVVVPLLRAERIRVTEPNLNPSFVLEGQVVVLHPLEIQSAALERLGERVGSLVAEGDRIIAAIDIVIAPAWG
jgi:toxin CcdB